jgi:hypothetical protein
MAEVNDPTPPDPADAEHHPAWHNAPWALALFIGLLVVLALIFVYFQAAATGETIAGSPGNVEHSAPGTWKSYGPDAELTIIFQQGGRYELRTVQSYTIVGPWEVGDEGVIEVEVDWRDYTGTWYFEPVSVDQMDVKVAELGYDLVFHKVN